MNKLAIALLVASCGYSARSNELVGQVKKVIDQTPIICGDYTTADISLGVIRNGVGSMSKEDVVLYVPNAADAAVLKASAETGKLVKVSYDVKRVTACVPDHWVTHVEVTE